MGLTQLSKLTYADDEDDVQPILEPSVGELERGKPFGGKQRVERVTVVLDEAYLVPLERVRIVGRGQVVGHVPHPVLRRHALGVVEALDPKNQ